MWNRVKWWQGEESCRGKFVRMICIFGVGDLPRLHQAKELFANKFHYDYNPIAYDCMEDWYNKKVAMEKSGKLDFDTTMYSNRYFVQNHF